MDLLDQILASADQSEAGIEEEAWVDKETALWEGQVDQAERGLAQSPV